MSASIQYYSDANEVESWIAEKMQLVLSEDCGKDKQSAKVQILILLKNLLYVNLRHCFLE